VIVEGNETPGGDPPRRSEGDLLAERRARRAAESGEQALTRRAEAAEATVRTLETHVASLQQRLLEAEQESRQMSDLIEAEQASLAGQGTPPAPKPSGLDAPVLEHELRRVRQREYAEQRLRVEAEDRCLDLERESRTEIGQLGRRLRTSERDARALATRLEGAQRELDEAEQAAAAERGGGRRAERPLQARLTELERRTVEIERELDDERAARERAERVLESIRRGQRMLAGLVAELRRVIARLREAAALAPAPEAPGRDDLASARQEPTSRSAPRVGENAEIADALAAAAERLRTRVEELSEQPPVPAARRAPHKHSMSLIGRLRLARKRRRERRRERRKQRRER
jgi:hypothetical protein